MQETPEYKVHCSLLKNKNKAFNCTLQCGKYAIINQMYGFVLTRLHRGVRGHDQKYLNIKSIFMGKYEIFQVLIMS